MRGGVGLGVAAASRFSGNGPEGLSSRIERSGELRSERGQLEAAPRHGNF